MNQPQDRNDVLQTVATVLLWCFGLGLAVLLFWFGVIVLAGDFVYEVHSVFFDISREHFEAIHYLSITLVKTAVFMLFLFPYVGIRMAMK
jgi:hypothetical protein